MVESIQHETIYYFMYENLGYLYHHFVLKCWNVDNVRKMFNKKHKKDVINKKCIMFVISNVIFINVYVDFPLVLCVKN